MNPRKTFTVMIVLVGLAFAGAPTVLHAEELLTIARDGQTQYTLVHADQASELEQKALQELRDFLGRVTGAAFPAKAESGCADNVRGIYVGWTKFAAQQGIETAKLGEEEWVIAAREPDLTGGRLRGTPFLRRLSSPMVVIARLAIQRSSFPAHFEFRYPTCRPNRTSDARHLHDVPHHDADGRHGQASQRIPAAEQTQRRQSPTVRPARHLPHFFQYVNARDCSIRTRSTFSLVGGKRLPATGGNGPGQLRLTHPDVRRIRSSAGMSLSNKIGRKRPKPESRHRGFTTSARTMRGRPNASARTAKRLRNAKARKAGR